jgi:hypothetical protein
MIIYNNRILITAQTFLYEKNKFMVVATTDEMDIFKINGIEYYESSKGILNSQTDQMFEC